MMGIGKAIKLCRTQQGLSQQELADGAGISVSYLSLLEHDKRDPAFSTVEKVAKALGMPLIALSFLASGDKEKKQLGDELCEKLSYAVLRYT